MIKTIVILDKTYRFRGQSHQFHLLDPTSSRFYNKHGILLYQLLARIPEEVGAWQEVGIYESFNLRQ